MRLTGDEGPFALAGGFSHLAGRRKCQERAQASALGADDVARLFSFLAFCDCEFDGLALLKAAVSLAGDGRIVDEDIGALFLFDETVAFFGAEPFDCAVRAFFHCSTLLLKLIIKGLFYARLMIIHGILGFGNNIVK